jgi:hypothetical protein
MVTNHQSLRKAIQDFLDRTDIEPYIGLFVQHAEFEMNRLRVRFNEKAFDETMVGGKIALPADYLSAKELYLDINPRRTLVRAAPGQVNEFHSQIGQPKMFAREGSDLIFLPTPDQEYTVKGVYHYKQPPLVNGTDTNWAIQEYPTWFLYECLAATSTFTREDDRLPIWRGLASEMRAEIERDNQRENWSGPMVQRRA